MGEVFKFIQSFLDQNGDASVLSREISIVLANPAAFVDDPLRASFAQALLQSDLYRADRPPAPWQRWGGDIDALALRQIELAANLPVSVAGALMPDAHVGYGLPIGGVLATNNAVIPYAVGVDIACHMKMTVLDIPVAWLDDHRGRLAKAIEDESKFGVGAFFKQPRQHDVMDEDWDVSPITAANKDRA